MTLFDDLPEPVSGKKACKRPEDETRCELPNKFIKPSIDLLDFLVSDAARKGERAEMQDAHIIVRNLRDTIVHEISSDIQRISLFAIFDGHGGERAANFAKRVLPSKFSNYFPTGDAVQIEKDMKRITINIYKKIDEEFLKEACKGRPHWKDGSTASSILMVNNTMYIANIGDSTAVVGRIREKSIESQTAEHVTASGSSTPDTINNSSIPTTLMAIPLTRDHTPLDYEERQRIIKCGASVVNGRINNALEVSRSFGDYQFKKQGVVCIPDVRKYDLTDRDRFLIIACDGLWKCFAPHEAVSKAAALLASNNILDEIARDGENFDLKETQRRLDSVCSQLTNEAVLRLSGDNVTCIIVLFIPNGSKS